MAAKKKNPKIYKKSKYYRKQQLRMRLIGAAAILLFLLLLLVLVVRLSGCSDKKEAASTTAKGDASQKNQEGSGDDLVSMAEESKEREPVTLTVSLTGDCTLGTDENFDYSTSLNAYFESNGSSYFFQNVKPIFDQDDLTIVNMEGTLTDLDTREDKQFAFKADASFANILKDGGVEAANMANNHSHDYGEQSYTDTLAALDAANIVHFGYDETAVMEVKGVKVAWWAFTSSTTTWSAPSSSRITLPR